MLLPSQFWVQHGNPPWCGGVERALMSTTADMAVAFHYANGKGTVVEIDVGRIQTGGDVSFLSMVRVGSTCRCVTCRAILYLSFLICKAFSLVQLSAHQYNRGIGGGEGLQYLGE